MSVQSKRTTVYLDPSLHKALKIKAAETSKSMSELVGDAIRHELAEDEEDLRAFEERTKERTVSFEKVLRDLKASGKI